MNGATYTSFAVSNLQHTSQHSRTPPQRDFCTEFVHTNTVGSRDLRRKAASWSAGLHRCFRRVRCVRALPQERNNPSTLAASRKGRPPRARQGKLIDYNVVQTEELELASCLCLLGRHALPASLSPQCHRSIGPSRMQDVSVDAVRKKQLREKEALDAAMAESEEQKGGRSSVRVPAGYEAKLVELTKEDVKTWLGITLTNFEGAGPHPVITSMKKFGAAAKESGLSKGEHALQRLID